MSLIGQQLENYRILEPIGSGGMGQVYLAEHVHLRKKYAVKVLPAELAKDRDFVNRFHDEARVMAELRHDRIVLVHNSGHVQVDTGDGVQEVYFLVMDYVTGPEGKPLSLHDHLKSQPEGRLPESQVHKWAMQIAEALAYAHEKGVVHRDIKPANILIDANGEAKLTDFGLAKAIGTDFINSQIHQTMHSLGSMRTLKAGYDAPTPGTSINSAATLSPDGSHRTSSASSILGTYDYMAPEQRGEYGGKIDQRTDIFALGIVLYRILTGRRPAGMIKPPSRLVGGLSEDWDELLTGCLNTEPTERFASMRELVAKLRSLSGLSPHAGTSPFQESLIHARVSEQDKLPESSKATEQDTEHNESRTVAAPTRGTSMRFLGVIVGLFVVVGIVWGIIATKPTALRNAVISKATNAPDSNTGKLTLDCGGGVMMELVQIPAGEFTMGSPESKWESPQHRVQIAQPFYMGKYEVTESQFQRFIKETGYVTSTEEGRSSDNGKQGGLFVHPDGKFEWHEDASWKNPGQPHGDEYPVTWVCWTDARAFCEWLSNKTHLRVRLPTEAEWEYACRAGTTTRFSFGNADADLQEYAWVGKNSGGRPRPVGKLRPNKWGLHDMYGNVSEWCEDRSHVDYTEAPTDGSAWNSLETRHSAEARQLYGQNWDKLHVIRGGSCVNISELGFSCSTSRSSWPCDHVDRGQIQGFRIAVDEALGRLPTDHHVTSE